MRSTGRVCLPNRHDPNQSTMVVHRYLYLLDYGGPAGPLSWMDTRTCPISGGWRNGWGGPAASSDHLSAERFADVVNTGRSTFPESGTTRLIRGTSLLRSASEPSGVFTVSSPRSWIGPRQLLPRRLPRRKSSRRKSSRLLRSQRLLFWRLLFRQRF